MEYLVGCGRLIINNKRNRYMYSNKYERTEYGPGIDNNDGVQRALLREDYHRRF